ncbi:spore wall protein 1 [Folsomia candida]|uniref:spore wall protein 1 n=1 Tax=Folsomia candida TaxID=158441 RepID=UPI000B9000EA|nr:spore wall protein 1 [Folsomia candida]
MHQSHLSKFCILICLVVPSIYSIPIWNIFGGNQNRGPRPEEGECSHWDRNNLYFSSYDSDDLIGFHRTFPQGSFVTVRNDVTNKSVVVRIVGEGPLADGRVMELSPAAFSQVSRLSEIVFDCKVYPPVGSSTGSGGGRYPSETGSNRYPSGGQGGYVGTGSSGYGTGTGSYTGNRYPNAGNYGYGSSANSGGSLGAGYAAIDSGSAGGTLNQNFGPPPILSGQNSGY